MRFALACIRAYRRVSINRRGYRRGQSLAEAALVFPILLMTLLLTIDLGRAYFEHLSLLNGAREGAMHGARHATQDCTAELAAAVSDELGTSVGCGTGTYQIQAADCYRFSPPATYTACGAGPWDPTDTLVYGVRVVGQFQPALPLTGLLTGGGLGGTIPMEAVDYSPVLTNYGS